ncbi:DNA polymerase III beta subunit, N-terminal domain [Dyadobacter soli]|uniref:Beta sliding clamp n=1 Tax=Dyadobacter soli TaxID=659014 RepID=A0A1G7WLC2_9BACT|nr:DNA polymerase III subunit beta [Dyadobacter soli]SDG72716.1 DNA polymerase III beta subunit, N-terminal domain [Dyadobacter soli]
MKTSVTKLNEVLALTMGSKDLLKALNLVGKVVASNPIVPALENVKVEILTGKVQFSGNNLHQSITCSTEYNIIGDTGSFLLPHKKTVDLLKTLPDVPVTIVHTQNAGTCAVQIEVDGKKFKMASDAAKDFPMPPLTSGESLELPVKQLKEALTVCLSTVSNDTLRPSQLGVHFNTEAGEIVSCDGSNITIYRTGQLFDSKPFTIPSEFARLVIDQISDSQDAVSLEISDSYARISNDTQVITSILVSEKFVDYERAIPKSNNLKGSIDITEWSTAIKRSLIFTNLTTFQTRNIFSAGKLTIATQDQDFGSDSTQEIPFDGDFEFEIGLQGKTISNILQRLGSNTARLEMTAPNRGFCIFPDNTLAKELLIMSMPVMLPTA